ncbi:hypothetical protein ATANTOWER_004682 [Ataeniobius toweri]|uniref:Uncharacterized protein n=1 Tax=Ataeniobius toweri TaxID=208326 RepID=A0ABU7BE30_9TELE|nr:hypothetical protein [Ataeniobius toweri]
MQYQRKKGPVYTTFFGDTENKTSLLWVNSQEEHLKRSTYIIKVKSTIKYFFLHQNHSASFSLKPAVVSVLWVLTLLDSPVKPARSMWGVSLLEANILGVS